MGKNTLRYAVAQLSGSQGNSFTLEIESERGSQSVTYNPAGNIINFVNSSGEIIQFQNHLSQDIFFFTSNGFTYTTGKTLNVQGVYIGATLTGTATNFSL